MSVRSQRTSHDPKDSAIVDRATLRRQRAAIERWTALVVLLASFMGTIAAWGGGWDTFLAAWNSDAPPWGAVAGGVGLQVLLTYLQWHYYDRRSVSIPARLADAGLTTVGYGPLFLEWPSWTDTTLWLPWVIVGVVSFVVAWYPESRLVE